MNFAHFQPYELDEQVTEIFASLTKTSEHFQLVISTLYKATEEAKNRSEIADDPLPLDVCVSLCVSFR